MEEFAVQGRLLRWNDRSEKWDPHQFLINPPGVKLHHLEVSSPDGVINQLHLLATPSVRGGRTKVLVDDLSSTMFRHKLVQDQFVQWNWHQDAFGLQCRSAAIAKSFADVLDECRTTRSSSQRSSVRSHNSNGNEGYADSASPLQQVSAFTPVLQRDKSVSGSCQSIRRQNSLSLGRQNSSSRGSDTPSMLRLLEAIRQENKREREEIKARLARIESMVGQVLERDAAVAAAACASGMSTPMANRSPSPLMVPPPQERRSLASPALSPCPSPSPSSGPLPPPPPPPPAPAPDPPAASSAGAPPPPPGPPPPPPPPGGGGGLAAQLAAAKLKKAETGLTPGGPPQPPAPSGPPKMDFASELQNRIRKRSAMNNE